MLVSLAINLGHVRNTVVRFCVVSDRLVLCLKIMLLRQWIWGKWI